MRLQQGKKVSSSDSAAGWKLRKCVQGKTVYRQYEKVWTELEVSRLLLCRKFKQYEQVQQTL